MSLHTYGAGVAGADRDDQFESTSMFRHTLPFAAITMCAAPPPPINPTVRPGLRARRAYSTQIDGHRAQMRYAAAPRREMGGGFIEFLFNGTGEPPRQQRPRQYIIRACALTSPNRALARAGSVMGYPRYADRGARAPPRWTRAIAAGGSYEGACARHDRHRYAEQVLYLAGDGSAKRYGIESVARLRLGRDEEIMRKSEV